MSRYVRKILLEIPPYIPGRSIESIQPEIGDIKIRQLASNENPLGPSPKAIQAIKRYLKNLHRYPDPNATILKRKLAQKLFIQPENILIGNGAAEIIDLIALAFVDPNDKVVMSYPTFPKYYLSVKRVIGQVKAVPMKDYKHNYLELLAQVNHRTKLVFIDNPCNPVGSKLGKDEQEWILSRLPEHTVLILDEAYREFTDEKDCLEYNKVLPEHKNVLFLRTLSKSYGLSGLRIGYLIGHSDTIVDVNRVREVFNVNSLALVAAEAALDDDEHLKHTLATNEKGKKYLYRSLENLGFEFQPTHANFIFIKTNRKLKDVDDFLLRQGIIIRPIQLNGSENGSIRVSIGKPSDNRAFILAMQKMRHRIPECD